MAEWRRGYGQQNRRFDQYLKSGPDFESDSESESESESELDFESESELESESDYEEKDDKSFYDTSDKRGLLCILQHKSTKWRAGNECDKTKLLDFFKEKLNFRVKQYRSYSELVSDLKKNRDLDEYYCLMICISAHGNEDGVKTDRGTKSVHEITKRFNNKNLPVLSGVPKIYLLDTCRGSGSKSNKKKRRAKGLAKSSSPPTYKPTSDMDCLIFYATTFGKVSVINSDGSVGIQCVVDVFEENWKKHHVEEMSIDVREAVASRSNDPDRQTLEIQSTLTKRLKLKSY